MIFINFMVCFLIIELDRINCFQSEVHTFHQLVHNLPSYERVSASNKHSVCNRTLSQPNDEILSPGYSVGYPDDLKCYWFINVQPNNSIRLEFTDFHLEHMRDFLTIHDGNSSSDRVLAKYTGSDLPLVLISSTNNLFLNFTSDHMINKTGFKITYRTIKFGCGARLNQSNNIIMSPGYPHYYTNNLNCIWNITVDNNKFIVIKIENLRTGDKNDRLSFYDQVLFNNSIGYMPISHSALAHFSGTLENWSLISKRNQIFVEFRSNQMKTGKGFKISYHAKFMEIKNQMIISVPFDIISIKGSGSTHYYQGLKTSELIDYNSNQLLFFRPEANQLVLRSMSDIHQDIYFNINERIQKHGLSIDWIHSLVYWIDIQSRTIKVYHLSQRHEKNIYTVCNITSIGDPGQLLYNNMERVLIWTLIGSPFGMSIDIGNPDGTNQRTLYYDDRKEPFHLTIDYSKESYYFIDITDYSLYSIDFNGQNEKFYLKSKLYFQSIDSMFVINNDLYLSDEHNVYRIPELENRIGRAQLLFRTNQNRNLIESKNFYEFQTGVINLEKIFGFRIQYDRSFLNDKNNCHKSNCSHLCLPTGHAFRCVCPIGFNLMDNEKCETIIKNKPLLKVKRRSGKHPTVNSLLIALLFVLILIFYVSYKLSTSEQDQSNEPDKSKRSRLRLIMNNDQDDDDL